MKMSNIKPEHIIPQHYVLFNKSTLGWVTRKFNDAFEFTCVTSNWLGTYDFSTGKIHIASMKKTVPATLSSIKQPPADMTAYDEIIDWMHIHSSETSKMEAAE
jgi:hypothetical protein